VQGSILTVRAGDTYLSPTWAVVINGAPVDLDDGWTVRVQARDQSGALVVDRDTDTGTDILLGTADVTVGESTFTTSTFRVYLSPATTTALATHPTLLLQVEIEHPTHGPFGDLYRATLVTTALLVTRDVARGVT
jgi:hypothetical protein